MFRDVSGKGREPAAGRGTRAEGRVAAPSAPAREGSPMNFLSPFFEVVDLALDVYTWIVIAMIVASWLVMFGVVNTRNDAIAMIIRGLYAVTEPVLRPIRRLLPSFGGIDLSPIVLFLLIYLIRRLLQELYIALWTAGI
jgi:YggT family protein